MIPNSEFLRKEFDAARTRIDKEIDQMNTNETVYVTMFLAINAALFQFNITNHWGLRFASVVMFLISVYGYWRYDAHRNVILLHESYIKHVIEHYEFKKLNSQTFPRDLGLMTYYDLYKGNVERIVNPGEILGNLRKLRYMIWIIIGVYSIIFFIFAMGRPESLATLYEKAASDTR